MAYSERYRLKGMEWSRLDAAARMLEEGKTTYLAQQMSLQGDIPVSKAERLVKSTPEWSAYIKNMVNARTAANEAKIDLEFIKMQYFERSGEEATKRAEMRM